MSNMHVAWIKTEPPGGSNPGATIDDVVSAQLVTTSTSSAASNPRPATATHAIVTAVDADLYVTNGGASVEAGPTTGVFILTGSWHCFRVDHNGRIAGIQA